MKKRVVIFAALVAALLPGGVFGFIQKKSHSTTWASESPNKAYRVSFTEMRSRASWALHVTGQDWRQIVPLKSTRADVERLLGPTKEPYFAVYHLKEGILDIEYSSGPCRPERKGGWNVPRGVVITLNFSPKRNRRIKDLKLDPKKFRKIVDDHVIGALYYVNDEEGITYAVQGGRVDFVEYGPARKDEHLYCGDPPNEKQLKRF